MIHIAHKSLAFSLGYAAEMRLESLSMMILNIEISNHAWHI
jgi:hypothetical protein